MGSPENSSVDFGGLGFDPSLAVPGYSDAAVGALPPVAEWVVDTPPQDAAPLPPEDRHPDTRGAEFGEGGYDDFVLPEHQTSSQPEDRICPPLCKGCPLNDGSLLSGPVETRGVGFGSDAYSEYVDHVFVDDEGNRTKVVRTFVDSWDGGIGSDESDYVKQIRDQRRSMNNGPVPSQERSMATLGLGRHTVPRCCMFYDETPGGKATPLSGFVVDPKESKW